MLAQVSLDIEKVILNHYLHSQREYEIPNDRIPLREEHATYWEDTKHILEKKRGRTLLMNIHQAMMTSLMAGVDHLQKASEDCESRSGVEYFSE